MKGEEKKTKNKTKEGKAQPEHPITRYGKRQKKKKERNYAT
jgi:hypothetical protein